MPDGIEPIRTPRPQEQQLSSYLWKFGLLIGVAAVALAAWAWRTRSDASNRTPSAERADNGPVPVEVAPIRVGPIELRRHFTGSLEPSAAFTVAPKVAGRIERIAVDLGDPVKRGEVVVELDDAELIQAAAQARAAVAVARAEHKAAESAAVLAERVMQRAAKLVDEGVGTGAELDAAEAELLRAKANIDVAAAELARAQAQLRAAEVRASYTRVRAEWEEGDAVRTVAARFVDEGDTVAPNTPLLTIVDLDPVTVVVFATEADYAELDVGKKVALTTDAYPGEVFEAHVQRIAPVFEAQSRQARVELAADNASGRLKPGMFVRASVILQRAEDATLVPAEALVSRNGRQHVFVASKDRASVALVPVTVGIREDGVVQVSGADLSGEVVTLGQQLLEDGSAIRIPKQRSQAVPSVSTTEEQQPQAVPSVSASEEQRPQAVPSASEGGS